MRETLHTNNAVFVDTGAFAALAIASDANHRIAIKTASVLDERGDRLFTTNFVVAETYTLILARSGRSLAIEILEEFDQTSDLIVRVAEVDEGRARQIVRRYDDKLFSLVDATSFAVMERLGITQAFTFDRHFVQFGFQALGLDE